MSQYSAASEADSKQRGVWMPAFAGMTISKFPRYAASDSFGTVASTERLRPLALAV